MGLLYNLARMTTLTTGTGTITLGSAVSGYLSFAAAGVADGDVVEYAINDGANSEIGIGTYTAAGTTLTRTVSNSTNSNNPISLSGAAQVFITPRSQLLQDASLIRTGTIATARLGSGTANSSSFLRGDQTWQGIPYDFRNSIVNGSFDIWQRGAGGSASFSVVAATPQYVADRWYFTNNASQACTVSQQAGITTNSRYCLRALRNSAQTGTGTILLEYPLTTDEVILLRGKNITVQGVFKAGANWSPTSGTVTVNCYFGTGAEGRRGTVAYTGETNPLTTTLNVTAGGSNTQLSFTGASTVATNATQGCLQFSWTPTGTAGAADSIDIDDVQLEPGTFATQVERFPFGIMLREMQRHYCKSFSYNVSPAQNLGTTGAIGGAVSGLNTALCAACSWRFPVSMRIAPTITTYNTSAANAQMRCIGGAGADCTATAATAGIDGVVITATSPGINGGAAIHAQADAGL